jgi:hypothetical protein
MAKKKLVKNPIEFDMPTKYEYTLSELESGHEGPFVHNSHRESRDSIEAHGLRPSKPGYDEHKGVYVQEHPNVYEPTLDKDPGRDWAENASQYGGDIYHIDKPKETKVYSDEQDAARGYFFHKTIKHSDLKRTGHIFRNDQGHAQVHWHKEEECPEGKTFPPATNFGEQFSRHSDQL